LTPREAERRSPDTLGDDMQARLRQWVTTTVVVIGLLLVAACPAQALAPSTVTIEQFPDPIDYGDDVTFTATVAGSMTRTTPTGSVQFRVDGADDGAPVMLDSGGAASFVPSAFVDVGATITALYRGDATFDAASAGLQATVTPATTSASISSSANPVIAGGLLTFGATVVNTSTEVTPAGSVQFIVDDEPVGLPQALDDAGQASLRLRAQFEASVDTVTGVYHDDTGDFADASASLTQVVNAPVVLRPAPLAPTVGGSIETSPPAAAMTLTNGHRPRLIVNGRGFVVDTGRQAACPAGGSACTVAVTGAAKAVGVGRATRIVAAGSRARITFVLNARGKGLLRARKRLAITAKITTRVGSAPSRQTTTHLTISRPKSARR
jgi:Bacterial Ig-like domain (group 3)